MTRAPYSLATTTETRDKSVVEFCAKRARLTFEATQALAFDHTALIWNDDMSGDITFKVATRLDDKLMGLRMNTVLPSEVGPWTITCALGRLNTRLGFKLAETGLLPSSKQRLEDTLPEDH